MRLTLDQAMLIYQRAIDKTAGAEEGAAWWAEVAFREGCDPFQHAMPQTSRTRSIKGWSKIWAEGVTGLHVAWLSKSCFGKD